MAEDNKQDPSAAPAADPVLDVDSAPFVDDIVIWDEGLGAPRKLTQKQLQGLPKIPTDMMSGINSLISQGVTIAAIPTTSGIGAACYLVNLTTIKKPDSE